MGQTQPNGRQDGLCRPRFRPQVSHQNAPGLLWNPTSLRTYVEAQRTQMSRTTWRGHTHVDQKMATVAGDHPGLRAKGSD